MTRKPDCQFVVGRSVRSRVANSFDHPQAKSTMLQVADLLAAPKSIAIVRKGGAHALFDRPQIVVLDSGGFQWLRLGRPPLEEEALIDLYRLAKPDFAVALDRPFMDTSSKQDVRAIAAENLARFRRMRRRLRKVVVVPVIHGLDANVIESQCVSLLRTDPDLPLVALGGAVPSLKELTRNFRSGRDRERKLALADALIMRTRIVREAFPKTRIHHLGSGGPVSMAIAIASGANSTDSAGWRIRAAYGRILMPLGRQVRNIAGDQHARRRLLDWMSDGLWTCKCPTCKSASSSARAATELSSSFSSRATHNLYQQFQDIQHVSELMLGRRSARVSRLLADHPLKALLTHLAA